MTSSKALTWRKGFFLSASFFIAISMAVGCKKKTSIGQSTLDQNQILNSEGVDTFSLITYSRLDDTVITDNPAYELLGSYTDPVFGEMNAEFYTQLELSAFTPTFDMDSIVVDSFVLALSYRGLYGKPSDQFVEVFEINEPGGLSLDSTYYSFSTVQTDPTDLVLAGTNIHTFDANPAIPTVVDDDTLETPQLRIHLDTTLCRNMMINAGTNPENWTGNDAFREYFKGIHVRTNNAPWASGEGGVAYFNLNDAQSQLIMYYHEGSDKKEFEFRITSESADFNHVDFNRAGTLPEAVANIDTTIGMNEFYAQAFGMRGVVYIPGLDNIPKNAVIHKAVLELPVQYQTGTELSPGTGLTVASYITDTSTVLANLGVIAQYSNFTKSFEVDVRQYVQTIVNDEVDNTGLYLGPIFFISSADRVVFNGSNTDNKEQPRFRILYTEF